MKARVAVLLLVLFVPVLLGDSCDPDPYEVKNLTVDVVDCHRANLTWDADQAPSSLQIKVNGADYLSPRQPATTSAYIAW